MPIGAVSNSLIAAQLPQQQLQALQAIAQSQAEEQAVVAALETGVQAGAANPDLGQLLDLSV
jgi:hypothetical protein